MVRNNFDKFIYCKGNYTSDEKQTKKPPPTQTNKTKQPKTKKKKTKKTTNEQTKSTISNGSNFFVLILRTSLSASIFEIFIHFSSSFPIVSSCGQIKKQYILSGRFSFRWLINPSDLLLIVSRREIILNEKLIFDIVICIIELNWMSWWSISYPCVVIFK